MLQIILAAILAGCTVSSAELIFIIILNGPFWITPALYFKTWLVYSTACLLILTVSNLTLGRLPIIKKRFSGPELQFLLNYALATVSGAVFIMAMMIKDISRIKTLLQDLFSAQLGWSWIFIFLIVIFSLFSYLILFKLKNRIIFSCRLCLLTFFAVASVLSVFVISDGYYGNAVQQRAKLYSGFAPDICLLVIDTARSDHFSAYGYPFRTTPNIDEFAGEGILCLNSYSPSNRTPPGHISLLTGTFPSQNGYGNFMPDSIGSISEILKEKGYYSLAFYANPLAGRKFNITRGFDRTAGVNKETWVYPGWIRLCDFLKSTDSGCRPVFAMTESVIEWMNRKNGKLLLFLNVLEPHLVYDLHEPYFSQFNSSVELDKVHDPALIEAMCQDVHIHTIKMDSARVSDFNEQSYAYLNSFYDSELAYTDHNFGLMANRLRTSGLLDSVLMVITSDHGEFLGEHCSFGHSHLLFEPVIEVPLIFRYPGRLKPARITERVSTVDVVPTIIDLMGLSSEMPEAVLGISILQQEEIAGRSLLCEHKDFLSLFRQDYKLILKTNPDTLQGVHPDTLLFNIRNDPAELHDLHDVEIELCADMARELMLISESISAEYKEEVMDENLLREMKALGYIK